MALALVCACIDLLIKVIAIRQRLFRLCYIQKLEFRSWRQAIGFIAAITSGYSYVLRGLADAVPRLWLVSVLPSQGKR